MAATIHGIPKDDLESEDVRQHRRARRLARSAVIGLAVLLVASISAGVLALRQRNRAVHSAAIATQRQVAAIASNASAAALAHRNSVDLALLLAAAAYRLHDAPDTRGALASVLANVRHLTRVDPMVGEPILGVSPSSDGSEFALARANRRVEVWTTHPLRRRSAFSVDAPLWGVKLSPNGAFVASQTITDGVALYDAAGGRLIRKYNGGGYGGGSYVGSAPLAFSPDSRTLAYAAATLTFVDTGSAMSRQGPTYCCGAKTLAFVGDASRIAAGTIFGGASITRLTGARSSSATPIRIPGGTDAAVSAIAVGADAHTLAFGTKNGDVGVYSLAAGAPLWEVRGAHGGAVRTLTFDPSHRLLASTGGDGRVLVWDSRTGAAFGKPLGGIGPAQVGAFFVAGGTKRQSIGRGDVIMTFGTQGSATWAFDSIDIGTRRELPNTVQCGMSTRLRSVGTMLLSYGDCGYTWDLARHELRGSTLTPFRATEAPFPPSDASVTPDRIAMVSFGTGITVYDAHTGRPRIRIRTGARDAADGRIALRADGQQVALAVDSPAPGTPGELRVFDVTTGRLLHRASLPTAQIDTLTWSPDGRVIAIGGDDGAIDMYDVGRGRATPVIATAGREIDDIAFDRDARWFTATSGDGTVRIVDVATRRARPGWISPGTGPLAQTAISDDARTLSVLGWEGSLTRWDVPSGLELGVAMPTTREDVVSIADIVETALPGVAIVGPDQLVTSSADNSVTFWDLRPSTLLNSACKLAARDLTLAEWRSYMGSLPYRKTCP